MVRTVVALLAALAVSALMGCTSRPDVALSDASPVAVSPASSSTRTTTTPGTGADTTARVIAPAFASTADRDTAFIAQLAMLTWVSPAAGPGYPTKFRRSALEYESLICSDARHAGSASDVTAPTEQLSTPDRATLVRLSLLFYCPSLADAGTPSAHLQKPTCPRVGDILVTSLMSPAMMTDNYFYSTVTYVIAFMNLTDYPVWIQPEVKWTAGPIYKGLYATGDTKWNYGWQLFSDPRAPETTPGHLLKAGEVWRVDAGQSGPYVWRSLRARADPTAFVPAACGYQPE